MGIGSLFVLSLGLSVLVEVVRMLNGWERRESQRNAGRVPFGALAPQWRLAPAAVLGSWVVTSWTGLDQRVK
jgi:hypothetical protein